MIYRDIYIRWPGINGDTYEIFLTRRYLWLDFTPFTRDQVIFFRSDIFHLSDVRMRSLDRRREKLNSTETELKGGWNGTATGRGGGEGENEAVVSGTRSFGRLPWERCFLTGR